nr:DUF3293 domain-containing protein [Pseudomaricurvus alcaniphilus]
MHPTIRAVQADYLSRFDTPPHPSRVQHVVGAILSGAISTFLNELELAAEALPATLLSAYLATEYRVLGNEEPFVLRIGEQSPDLLALFEQQPVKSACFLTACNSYSETVSAQQNSERQSQLQAELEELGPLLYLGEGADPNGKWPAEPSFLVVGIKCHQAMVLAVRFEQTAIVWMESDAVPRLLITKGLLSGA